MVKFFKDLFKIEKSPRKGLLPLEWVVLAYILFTTLVLLFTATKNPDMAQLIIGRMRILVITLALWFVYRMVPCRFMIFVRIVVQMALLSWWYPDTYDINKVFPNLDHVFAQLEQDVFGFQPALVFSQNVSSAIFSELMDMGYASYYPMIVLVTLFYFFKRNKEFERTAFVIMASFFIFYVIFVLVPVTGPQFYYKAVGLENIANGVFPNVHDYFMTHTECLVSPGYQDGLFYGLVEDAKNAGERPTAAFPSSHVGISTILMLLAYKTKNKSFTLILLPFYILMFFATFYIQAHYAIDAIAGIFAGVIIFLVTYNGYKLFGKK